MDLVPTSITPRVDEAAILSVLAARADGEKLLVAGSLLTVPVTQAATTWRRWMQSQPLPPIRRGLQPTGFDLGPSFEIEPFPGVLGARRMVQRGEWQSVVDELGAGQYLRHPRVATAQISPSGRWVDCYAETARATPITSSPAPAGRSSPLALQ